MSSIDLVFVALPHVTREEAHCLLRNLKQIELRAAYLQKYPQSLNQDEIADLRTWLEAIEELL